MKWQYVVQDRGACLIHAAIWQCSARTGLRDWAQRLPSSDMIPKPCITARGSHARAGGLLALPLTWRGPFLVESAMMLPLLGLCTMLPAKAPAPLSPDAGSEPDAGESCKPGRKHRLCSGLTCAGCTCVGLCLVGYLSPW